MLPEFRREAKSAARLSHLHRLRGMAQFGKLVGPRIGRKYRDHIMEERAGVRASSQSDWLARRPDRSIQCSGPALDRKGRAADGKGGGGHPRQIHDATKPVSLINSMSKKAHWPGRSVFELDRREHREGTKFACPLFMLGRTRSTSF
jgi:hypothetical protein